MATARSLRQRFSPPAGQIVAARKPAQLKALREEKQALELRAEIAELRRNVELAEGVSRVVMREAWGDPVDSREYLSDVPGFYPSGIGDTTSRPEDRKDGDFVPLWRTELEHAEIRGIARFIAVTDEIAIAALENLTNYIVGTGFEFDVQPRQDVAGVPDSLVRDARRIVDQFLEDNDFVGDLDREIFQRSRRDGEVFLHFRPLGRGRAKLSIIEPEFVTEPIEARAVEEWYDLDSLAWKYGIGTRKLTPSEPLAYFVRYFGSHEDWEVLSAFDVVHLKENVDRSVKRGLSDFYAVWRNLQNAEKLLGNTVEGAAIQACIAYIREHSPAYTEAQITSLRSAGYDYTRTTSPRGKTEYVQKFRPGTILDTNGTKYHAGPLGSPNHGSYIEVLQAAYRVAGIRWTMPEYMISGDASNGNFASTLVAESPFTKSAESKQYRLVRKFKNIIWRLLRTAALDGALQVEPSLVKAYLDVEITPPEVAVRNRTEDHQIRKEEFEAGIRSASSWAAEAGLDYDEEVSRGARRSAAPVDPGAAMTPLQRQLAESWLNYP